MRLFCYFLLSASIALSTGTAAQQVSNGSFEKDDIPCSFNVSNTTFNGLIQNAVGYGAASQLDILKDSCGFGLAQHGRFFLGIAVDSMHQADALSLSLTAPLSIGQRYLLTYSTRKAVDYSATPVSIGYATSPAIPGNLIGVQAAPSDTNWQQQQLIFTPTTAATWLSLTATGNIYTWTHLDNFELSFAPLGIGNEPAAKAFTISPNPAHHKATVYFTSALENETVISVIDFTGRIDRSIIAQYCTSAEIDLDGLAPGIYCVKVASEKGIASSKIVVAE